MAVMAKLLVWRELITCGVFKQRRRRRRNLHPTTTTRPRALKTRRFIIILYFYFSLLFFLFFLFPFYFFRRVLAKTCSRVLRMVVASVGRRSAVRSHLCWLAFCCSRDCRSYILPTEICLSGKKKESPRAFLLSVVLRDVASEKIRLSLKSAATLPQSKWFLHCILFFFLYFLYTFCITSAI